MPITWNVPEPYKTEFFSVSKIHSLYIEQSGNPMGKPILSFHGGPGGHSKPEHRRFFDPTKYRIILFDQRGCGKSTPLGETRQNTTPDLVEDAEIIRKHLGIDRWVVQGNSWGSTLALAYAEGHSQVVKALILQGIFLFRKWEVAWFSKQAQFFYPEAWDTFDRTLNIKNKNPNLLMTKAHKEKYMKAKIKAVQADNRWMNQLYTLIPEPKMEEPVTEPTIAASRIQYHYIKHNGFIQNDELLKNAHRLKNIPAAIIQGRYDMCCPPISAWDLYKKMPHADFVMLPLAGHHSSEPAIEEKIIEYAHRFESL